MFALSPERTGIYSQKTRRRSLYHQRGLSNSKVLVSVSLKIASVYLSTSLVAQTVKNLPAVRSWRREWLPTPVLLPGEFHRQRSLVGYSPWGCKEKDRTEPLSLLSIHSHHSVFLYALQGYSPILKNGSKQKRTSKGLL